MPHSPAPYLFVSANLLPALALIAGAILGENWPFFALFCMTILVLIMDRAGLSFDADASLARGLPIGAGGAHFATLGVVVWAIGQPEHLALSQSFALILAAGLYAGQVSNACAHELIHRSDRFARGLGKAMYCSLLNGQHVSAHLLVHHVHAGTSRDPNSAPMGQSFYRYLLKTSVAEFRAGLVAETARRAQQCTSHHPYFTYIAFAAATLIAAGALSGWLGVIALVAIALHAQMQLLLSDYVQHYGLRRKIRADGKPEPMGPQHSWNAPQPYSSALMFNATRHSDHHIHPGRNFTDLSLDNSAMPMLPRSVPVMGAIAFVPPLWRKMMDPRAQHWSGATLATASPPASAITTQ